MITDRNLILSIRFRRFSIVLTSSDHAFGLKLNFNVSNYILIFYHIMCLALCLCWVLFSFIHFPNRKLDKSVCPQPQLIFCGVDPLSLSINMHESSWALVLNGLDPCVYECESVFFVPEYVGIGWVLVRFGLCIKKLCLFHTVYCVCAYVRVLKSQGFQCWGHVQPQGSWNVLTACLWLSGC